MGELQRIKTPNIAEWTLAWDITDFQPKEVQNANLRVFEQMDNKRIRKHPR
jgi:hypothetical protein